MIYSSVDPNKIALTIKGLGASVPAVIMFLSFFNISVGAEDLNQIIDALAQFVVLVGTIVSLAVTLYGLVRKVLVKVRS